MNPDRRSNSATRWAVTGGLALVLAAPGIAAAQTRYSGVVVFGTSLSDSGNAFVLVGDQNTPADFDLNPFLIPSAPYAKGGHHFSNGATWIEQFARGAGLGGSVKAALGSSSTEANNYAVGAARAWEDGVNFNLTRQVSTFLSRSGTDVSPTALYVIEMGGNDVRDAFQMYIFGGPTGPVRAGGDPDRSTRVNFGKHPNALPRRCARLPGMVVAKHRTHTRNPAARPAGRRAGRRIGSVLQLQPDQGGRRTFSRASRCDLRPARRVRDSGGDRGTSRKLRSHQRHDRVHYAELGAL